MSKISYYPSADEPLQLSDRLIGTEAPRIPASPTPLATKNFSLSELLDLFSSNFPAASLQAVLNTGNTATQNITLTGTITSTVMKPTNIEDTSGSQGTTFQILSKGASSINWINIPIDNLQAVLSAGSVATGNISLTGNITSTRIIPGNIQDDTAGIGTVGQVLSKTSTGIRWITNPALYTAGLADVLSVGNTSSTSIFIEDTNNSSEIATSYISATNLLTGSVSYLDASGYLGLGNGIIGALLKVTNITESIILEFPNKPSGTYTIATTSDVPASVTSVGLTMPSAFSVANSPITSAGTLAVTGAGVVSQYVRGDGSLANFPTSTGGGSSLAFYLNGSVSQGTIGGVAFREMDRTPILGAGTDFTISSNGYIQSFITDANVPNLLEIPAGNWNFETYFSSSSNGGSPSFYIELYKWNGVTLSLIASNSANPEGITNGTVTDLYVSALAVPQTTLLATDRLAVRIYVTPSGRTIKLHTENGHLCEIITTFSTGITALNGLTAQVQSFATGTSGTDFGISSATATHTFNLPTASATNRGALSPTDWNTFNNKFTLPALTSGSVLFSNGTTIAQKNAQLFWDDTNNRLGIGTATPVAALDVNGTIRATTLRADALNNTANTVTLIQFSGTGNRLFDNSGVQVANIRNSNFQIGTTTDAGYKLDVNGTARVSGTLAVKTASGQQRISFSNTDQIYIGLGANNNQIGANSSNRLYIGSEGDLPIYTLAGGTVIVADLANPASSASAKLRIDSTTQGFLPPRMTTTQKNAIATPAAGLVVYDTTLGKLCVRTAAAWETITSI